MKGEGLGGGEKRKRELNKLETDKARKKIQRDVGEWRMCEEEEREREERPGRGGEDKGRAVFPDVAAVCWLFAAPAPRITAFTLQLKNSPRDNLFSWSTPSSIVFPENSFFFFSFFHFLPVRVSYEIRPLSLLPLTTF